MKPSSQLFFLKNEDKDFCYLGNNNNTTTNHNPSKFKCKYIFEQKPYNPSLFH